MSILFFSPLAPMIPRPLLAIVTDMMDTLKDRAITEIGEIDHQGGAW